MQFFESLTQHTLRLGTRGGGLCGGTTGAISYRATNEVKGEQLLMEDALLPLLLLFLLRTADRFWGSCRRVVRGTNKTDGKGEHLFDLPELSHLLSA